MKKLLFILLLTIPFIGFGQGWEKTFGSTVFGNTYSDIGNSVQQTTDGGYIITGHTESFGPTLGKGYLSLIKTDGNGDTLWNKTFGGNYSNNDWGRSVQQTSDGGYIICGENGSFGNGNTDVWLIKTDENGVEEWNQTFGGTDDDWGRSVEQTTDGGYIITGHKTSSISLNGDDIWLIKTDDNGVEQWNQTFGGMCGDYGYSVQQTTDGGYIITGLTECVGGGTGNDVWLIKTDGNGVEEWNEIFSGGNNINEIGYSVEQTTDGGYIISGTTTYMSFSDIFLIKTNGNGVEQWNKTFVGTILGTVTSVRNTSDGGYVIVGTKGVPGGSYVWLIKTDGNGVEQWDQTFGGNNQGDFGNSVQQTTDGGYIITGMRCLNPICNYDIYLIKTDSQGNITSTFNNPTPSSNRKLEKVVDILGRETKPQKNTPFIEIYDDGSVEKKIVIE